MPDGRGELALNLRLPTTNAPTPTTAVQTNRITHGRPYNTASELPLSEPSRAHLSPKGEAYCMNHANKTALNPLLNNPLIWKWS